MNGNDFEPMWLPIVHYDRARRPTVLLRQGSREIFGRLGEHARWGEILDGDFLMLRAFEPTEFAIVPDGLMATYSLPR